MLPAAKRLAAGDAHRVHRHDRLVDDAQRLGLDRSAQIGLHHLAAAEGGIHRRLEKPPVVLAEFLGLVEGKVGLDDHGVDIGVLDARQHGAAAGLYAQRMAGDVDLPLKTREYLVEDAGQMAFVLDVVDEDHEFVAAEAADLDRIAGEGREPLRDGVDQAVADGMPERIVDALEVVEIEHRKAAAAVAVAGRHRFGDKFVEIGAVRQARQIVEARHGADLFLGLDALALRLRR